MVRTCDSRVVLESKQINGVSGYIFVTFCFQVGNLVIKTEEMSEGMTPGRKLIIETWTGIQGG